MQNKDLIGLTLLAVGVFGATTVACISYRLRSALFVLMVALTAFTERLEINFVSREWYRGTTRGFELSIVDILSISLLLACLLFPRPGVKRFYWPASLAPLLLFFVWCCVSCLIGEPRLFGMFELSKLLRGIIIFLATAMFVRTEREVRLLVLTLGGLVAYECLLAIDQRYLRHGFRVGGTFGHPNSLSMYLCTTVPIFVAVFNSDVPKHLRWLSVAILLLGPVAEVLTISRAGVAIMSMLLLGATLKFVRLRLNVKQVLATCVVLLFATGVAVKSWGTMSERFKESKLSDEYTDSQQQNRGYYLLLAKRIIEDRWWGVGPNNWSYWVSNVYGPRLGFFFVPYIGTDIQPSRFVPPGRDNLDAAQAAPAHCLAALTMAELGVPGFFIFFGLLWMRWFQLSRRFFSPSSTDPMLRIGAGLFFGLCGMFLQSLTEWIFHQTQIFYMFNILIGLLAALTCIRRERENEQYLREQPPYEESEPVRA